ncbi:MAG TPA: phosphatidate cytidylyltransferase [Steroidobacteraceae bacterium]|jgi:phosphatidate cytidylyltransferase
MLKLRIITGLILGTLLLLGIFLLPPLYAVLGFGVVFTIAAWEWAGFAGLKSAPARTAYAALVALALYLAWRLGTEQSRFALILSIACAWWVVAFFWLALAPARHRPPVTLFCGFLVLPPAFLALARLQVSSDGFAPGPQVLLLLVFLVTSADIGAYFAGRSFGKRKLAPRVSPGKTWEGLVGGMIAVALVAAIGAVHYHLPLLPMVTFGVLVGLYSVIGDLTESMFKRAAALKDSGTILPGHGGMLDRLDSVTAAAPLYALGLFGSGVLR